MLIDLSKVPTHQNPFRDDENRGSLNCKLHIYVGKNALLAILTIRLHSEFFLFENPFTDQ